MPGGWPISYSHANHLDLASASTTSSGTVVTASGSTNTKGSFIQLIASTASDAAGIWLCVNNQSATGANSTLALDIALGAAASEVVVLANILITAQSAQQGLIEYFPLAIPSGTRVSARIQAKTVSETVCVNIITCDAGFDSDQALTQYTTYNTNLSGNTTVTNTTDPGTSANTKGVYAQQTSSTTSDIYALWLVMSNVIGGVTQMSLVDIAIGAAASEVVIIPNIMVSVNAGSGVFPGILGPFKVNIPSGTRIATRSQCSSGTAPNRKLDLSIIGAG